MRALVVVTFALMSGTHLGFCCTPTFHQLFSPQPFSPSDFPESQLWSGSPKDLAPPTPFSIWAAHHANLVAQFIHEGRSLQYIFTHLAQARLDLAMQMTHHDMTPGHCLFGRLKTEEGELQSFFHSGITPIEPYMGHRPNIFQSELNHLAQDVLRASPIRQDPDSLRTYYRTNTYVSSTQHVIATSTLYTTGRIGWDAWLFVEHPRVKDSLTVFEDIQLRLEHLRDQPLPILISPKTTEEFLAAMFGYYNAIPYRRGSSAMGRVFFHGFFLAVFGKKPPFLPDGMDVRAMILDQQSFLNTFRGLFSP